MKPRSNNQLVKFLFGIALAVMILCLGFGLSGSPAALAQEAATPASNNFYTLNTVTLSDGTLIDQEIINGPPVPPPGFELEQQAVSLPESNIVAGINNLTVPAYDWVFGCSSVSGAMIAAYYDRNGFPNMYTGPTNGGVMPLDNSSWPTWSDGVKTYPNLPLAASKNGVDGRSSRGSIDDYWIQYDSTASDPYITGAWAQHTWGDAIGDYMKTSQSAFENTDGSTTFYTYTNNPDRLTCATMASDPSTLTDGTLGRKLFYEYRGYTVTDCYNQKTDNNEGGFTYAMFKAEIDAGRPVMLNLVGHTVVGVGYDDSTNTVYIHDTWDYSNHTMIWGGSYSGMALRSVSIVNIQSTIKSTRIYLPLVVRALPGSPPGSFNKSAPSNGTTSQPANPTLSWSASSNATSYEYCLDTSNNAACDATWISTGTSTSAGLSNLSPATSYYWQVHAKNSFGTVDADGGTWWSFTTTGSPPSNGIVNGDFETGSTGWTEYSYQGWSIILNSGFPGSVTPHSGSWVAWLGGDDDEIAYIQQQVTISAGAPYLSYYHWIASEDFCGYDFGEVLINGILVNDYSLCSDNNTGGWVKHSVNLSAYAGQSVTLRIGVETDSAFNSNLFIDDVSLQASLSASGQIDGILPHLDASTSLGKAGIVTQGEKPQGIREILLMITR